MEPKAICGRVVTPLGVLEEGTVLLREGRIEGVIRGHSTPSGYVVDEYHGMMIFPGLIDLHIHGALGEDATDSHPGGLMKVARFLAGHGVTAFLPTTMSERFNTLLSSVRNIKEVMKNQAEGAQIVGIHLEGPYLAPERKGAHNPAYLKHPVKEEIGRLLEAGEGAIRRVTLAPDLPGGLDAVEYLASRGIVVSLGHSKADYKTAMAAWHRGARMITHLFNAMDPLHHRIPNLLAFALSFEGIWCEMIADGVHICPEVMEVALRSADKRLFLVSDAVRPAGLGDGSYSLGGEEMEVQSGVARIRTTGSLAGSTFTLNRMLGLLAERFSLSLSQLAVMGSLLPARVLGESEERGSIEAGKRADIAVYDERFRCLATYRGGKRVYFHLENEKGNDGTWNHGK